MASSMRNIDYCRILQTGARESMRRMGGFQFWLVFRRPRGIVEAGVRQPVGRPWMNMQHVKNGGRGRRDGPGAAFRFPALAALALFAGGCAHTGSTVDPAREPVQMLLPKLTVAVTGPAAGLLTNLDGFDCQFSVNFGAPGQDELTVNGALHERGGKLCFAPVFKAARRKALDAGGFIVIWDPAGRQGYVLSDALQGFAPVVADAPAAKAPELQVERAKDLNGLAIRIQSTDESRPFTLTLSGIKPGLPPEGMFAPPDGLTKYASETALLEELAARQRMVMGPPRKDEGGLGDYTVTPPGAVRPGNNTGAGY